MYRLTCVGLSVKNGVLLSLDWHIYKKNDVLLSLGWTICNINSLAIFSYTRNKGKMCSAEFVNQCTGFCVNHSIIDNRN